MRCGLHEINQSIFESLFFPEKLVPNTFLQILDRAVSTRISSIRLLKNLTFEFPSTQNENRIVSLFAHAHFFAFLL